jgi:predicted AlkP superfamily pyrophosphatase or phosphodiesterase
MEKLLALRRKLKKQHFAIFQENESFYRLKPESYDSGKLEGLFKDLKGLNVTPDHATIEKITGDLLDKWDIAYDRVSFNKNNDEYRYHELGYLKIRENSVNGDSFEVVIEYNMLDTTEKTEGFATTYNNHISSAGIGYKTSCTYHDLNYCSCIPSLCRLTKRKACSKNSVH